MRRLKFSLLTAVVLLAGALASWCAVQGVVAPQAGETISAGVLSVPSVLGQTAEEVLFYPWPLYETQQELSRICDSNYYKDDQAQLKFEIYLMNFPSVLDAFQLFGIDYDLQEMWKSLLWTGGNHGLFNMEGQTGALVFLRDFSVQRQGVSATADFATDALNSIDGSASISYLIRPAQAVELTQAQQDAALDRVKADLLDLLGYHALASKETTIGNPEVTPQDDGVPESEKNSFEIDLAPDNQLNDLLVGFLHYSEYGYFEAGCDLGFWAISEALYYLQDDTLFAFWEEPSGELTSSQASLEELLAVLENYGCTVQLISTPQQVILLFNLTNGMIFGVYYDIQLECYSGLGVQYLQH